MENSKRTFLHLDEVSGLSVFGKKRNFNFTLCGLYENNKLKIGFSLRHPSEKCNNKKLANKIALNRASKRPTHEITFDNEPSYKEMREKLKQAAEIYKNKPAFYGNKNNFARINININK